MKFCALSFLVLLGNVAAFAPTAQTQARSRLLMNEVAAESEPESEYLQVREKVPCFGAVPVPGSETGLFIGENYWDKLTTEYGSAETGTFLRAAELKHGRAAMIATVGFAFHKLGLTFDHISPHEYLSVTQNIKFADLAAMTPLDAMKSLPVEGYVQMFAAIAAIEIYELTHKDGEIKYGGLGAPGLQPGGLTGDLGWNPLQIKVTDRRRLVEIQNGRAAMFAICAWVAHDAVPGSVPLALPWP